jgi:putative flippase GtrA
MQFLLYCVCGGTGVLADYVSFYIFLTLGVNYQIANAAGYLVGTLVSFTLNRRITFGVHDRIALRLVLFVTVAAVGYVTSALILWFLVEHLIVGAPYAKLLTLPVVVGVQFSLNRWVTFRRSRNALLFSE